MKSLINISIISLLILSCSNKVDGCNDPNSCTYNPSVTNYVHGSCLYLDECGKCGGDNTTCLDECGVINGDNSSCLGCDGVVNSGLVLDECGNCEGQDLEYVELWGVCYNIEETTDLFLQDKNLTGEIPSEIGYLTNLINLSLSQNQLTGDIPSEIGTLTNLQYLDLGWNQLTGIPIEIGKLISLKRLYLYSNQLTGEIPTEICLTYQEYSTPSVGDNQFCPPYPWCISQTDIDDQDTSDCP